ncbi:MAG TPA: hypothetical protein VHL31_25820 [Geminicoccus sp.]|uniref:hypothetical protein n=1 Tax=Geminicoccus sp. TaxID=2024832 RepID=UPI002E336ED6|nr:hypothetical protein [Geminicoccus sp.]HEX2529693.1 hypothetical protein [Geminicoccus sp.]
MTALGAAAMLAFCVATTAVPSDSWAVRNDQATWPVAQSGWRYNLTVMREQAKTSSAKAAQYAGYLTKLDVDDAYVVAYAAALAAKFGGTPPTEPPVTPPSNGGTGETPPTEPTDPPDNGGNTGARKHVYQGFRYNKMPNFAGCGLSSLKIFYEGELFGGKSKSQPNISQLKNVIVPQILKKKWDYVVIDIEVWDEITEMDKLILAMKTIRDGVRAGGGTSKLGYYMMLPEKNWLAPVQNSATKTSKWRANNDKLKRLADEVDIIFPSLYTLYDNQGDWIKYAKANIAEARRYGKPVMPFIWPQIHNWNKEDGQKYMSASFWKTQLEVTFDLSDAVIIWGSMTTVKGSRGWDTWRSGMPWWEVTKSFNRSNAKAEFSGCNA